MVFLEGDNFSGGNSGILWCEFELFSIQGRMNIRLYIIFSMYHTTLCTLHTISQTLCFVSILLSLINRRTAFTAFFLVEIK